MDTDKIWDKWHQWLQEAGKNKAAVPNRVFALMGAEVMLRLIEEELYGSPREKD